MNKAFKLSTKQPLFVVFTCIQAESV